MRPNVLGTLWHALLIPAAITIAVSPLLWLFVDAVRQGHSGTAWAWFWFAVLPWAVSVVGLFVVDFRRRRRMLDAEFRE